MGLSVSAISTAGARLTYLPSVFSSILVASLFADALDHSPRPASWLIAGASVASIGVLLFTEVGGVTPPTCRKNLSKRRGSGRRTQQP